MYQIVFFYIRKPPDLKRFVRPLLDKWFNIKKKIL